jgi:hypothetical protein
MVLGIYFSVIDELARVRLARIAVILQGEEASVSIRTIMRCPDMFNTWWQRVRSMNRNCTGIEIPKLSDQYRRLDFTVNRCAPRNQVVVHGVLNQPRAPMTCQTETLCR